MLKSSEKLASERNAKDARQIEALSAFLALNKLMRLADASSTLKRLIDSSFARADEDGRSDDLLSDKVLAIVGASSIHERIQVEELLFLVRAKKASLISDIQEIEQRIINNEHLANVYTEQRKAMGEFVEKRSEAMVDVNHTRGTFQLLGTDALLADAKKTSLEQVVGQLIVNVEEDTTAVFKTFYSFQLIARDYFGEDFPDVNYAVIN